MMWWATSATDSSPSRSTGRICRSGVPSRRRCTSSGGSSPDRKSWSGSTPPRSMRPQDSSITGRGADGARWPDERGGADLAQYPGRACRVHGGKLGHVVSARAADRSSVVLPVHLTVRLIVPVVSRGRSTVRPQTTRKLQPLATLVDGPRLVETWANAVSQRRVPASDGPADGGGAVSAQHHPRASCPSGRASAGVQACRPRPGPPRASGPGVVGSVPKAAARVAAQAGRAERVGDLRGRVADEQGPLQHQCEPFRHPAGAALDAVQIGQFGEEVLDRRVQAVIGAAGLADLLEVGVQGLGLPSQRP